MKSFALAGIAAVLFAGAAYADPFDGIYGNTVTVTAPDGKKTVYYFNQDGTFENHFASGKSIKGTFVWKDPQTACFTVTDPAPKQAENTTNCRPFPVTHHVGDTWTETDSDGVAYTATITQGR